jgi:hypothetical protein
LKRSLRLSLFKQNNEVSLINLKKIVKSLKNPSGVHLGGHISDTNQQNIALNQNIASLSERLLGLIQAIDKLTIAEVNISLEVVKQPG